VAWDSTAILTVSSSMQNDPVVSNASELLRLGLMPSVDAIKAGQVSQRGTLACQRLTLCNSQDLLDVDISSAAANILLK
jgi:hypothetical protein